MGEPEALHRALAPRSPWRERAPFSTRKQCRQRISYVEPREAKIVPDAAPPVAFPHIVINLCVQREPVCRRAGFRAFLVDESSSRIDQQHCIARQLRTKIDVFSRTCSPVVFVESEAPDRARAKAHQTSSELPDAHRTRQPQVPGLPIDALAIIPERSTHEESVPHMPPRRRFAVIRDDSGYAENLMVIRSEDFFQEGGFQNDVVVEKEPYLTGGDSHRPVSGLGEPRDLGVMDVPENQRHLFGEGFFDALVHEDDFRRNSCLLDDTVYRQFEIARPILCRNNDGQRQALVALRHLADRSKGVANRQEGPQVCTLETGSRRRRDIGRRILGNAESTRQRAPLLCDEFRRRREDAFGSVVLAYPSEQMRRALRHRS